MKHTAMRKQLRMSTYSRYLLLNAIQKRLVIHIGTAKCSIHVAIRAVSWRKRGFREAKSYFIYTLCTTSTCPTGSTQSYFKGPQSLLQKTTADFLPEEQETLFSSSQNWLCLNWRKYIPYSALCFKKTNWNKFKGVQQELKQFWKGTLKWRGFFLKLKKANKYL